MFATNVIQRKAWIRYAIDVNNHWMKSLLTGKLFIRLQMYNYIYILINMLTLNRIIKDLRMSKEYPSTLTAINAIIKKKYVYINILSSLF